MKFYVGKNEEGPFYIGPCKTEEEAIAEAKEEYCDEIKEAKHNFEIVLGISKEVHVYIDAETLIENTAENMYDELYEDALDGWCEKISIESYNELSSELTEVVKKWLIKNKQDYSFDVIESYKRISISE